MFRYITRRLLSLIPLLLVISFVSFGIYQLSPGDPVKAFIPREMADDPAAIERMRAQLGLDKHWTVQYIRWMEKLVQGDLGRSMITGQPVVDRFALAIPNTLKLTITAWLLSFTLSIIVGVVSATRRYTIVDQAVTVFSFAGLAIPGFFLGLLLMLLFAIKLKWLPATGMYTVGQEGNFLNGIKHMIMPLIALAINDIAGTSRYVRSSLLEVLKMDYIRTARSKGLSERIVTYKHALRNSLMPVVTFLGLGMATFVGGSLVIENLFAWPGMGRVIIGAVFQNDYPMVMAGNLLFAGLTVVGNMIADIMYAVVDPRVKFS
ncbi:MAG: ABC transporter permease [Bacillota bacterium]